MLDTVNAAIEKLMTILVPGWSQADYLLEYSINSNIDILDIVIIAKTGPGSKMIDRVLCFGCLIKITKSHKKNF